jgi:hypothetical protein
MPWMHREQLLAAQGHSAPRVEDWGEERPGFYVCLHTVKGIREALSEIGEHCQVDGETTAGSSKENAWRP